VLYVALFGAQEHTCVFHVTGEEGIIGLALYPGVLQCYDNREHIPSNLMGIDARWEAPYWGFAVVPLPLKWTCFLLLSSKLSH